MCKSEVERKDLRILFKDWSPVTLSSHHKLTDDVDLTAVLRLLSLVVSQEEEKTAIDAA